MFRILYKDLKSRSKSIRIHILCWSVFIIYEVSLSTVMFGGFKRFSYYVVFYLLNISVFYFHSLVLLKKGIAHKFSGIIKVSAFTILELLVYSFIAILISSILTKRSFESLEVFSPHSQILATAFFRGVYFVLYGTAYYILMSYHEKKEKTLRQHIENEQLKNDVLRAEQAFLRAQINPHLLFNTLNFIKYATKKKPEEAKEAIMMLSGIMSFALENNSETVLLTREMEQVENIIKLNQLRFNHTICINYIVNLHDNQIRIIPVILLTLVENVFKHGNLMDKNHPAEIRVESTRDYLLLQTSNLVSLNTNLRSTKTGLNNIASRLNQAYKGNHSFTYILYENLFKVNIKIMFA